MKFHAMKNKNIKYACLFGNIVILLFLIIGQFGALLNAQIYSGWHGESGHAALSIGLGHEFSFVDYAQPFFNSTPVPLVLSSSFTQQYSLLVSSRHKNPFLLGRMNRYKCLELGFGFNVLHRSNQGSVQQQTQVIERADSSLRIVSANREVDMSNLSIGISGLIEMPTYIFDKLRVRIEPNVNFTVWDKTRNVLSIAEKDTSVVFQNNANITYSNNGRVASLESSGNTTFGMVYSLKLGISYSILILLRETPWIPETKQYGEIQPYINYTLSSAQTLSSSHRVISGLQIGVRFTIPQDLFSDESDYDPSITW